MDEERIVREIVPRLTRGDYGDPVHQEVGMVWDHHPELETSEWRPARIGETPTGWGVWDSDYGWIVGID